MALRLNDLGLCGHFLNAPHFRSDYPLVKRNMLRDQNGAPRMAPFLRPAGVVALARNLAVRLRAPLWVGQAPWHQNEIAYLTPTLIWGVFP